MDYPIVIEPDDNETLLVTCPDLPEVTTFGEDEEDAVQRAGDAIEEALVARMARHESIPSPSPLRGRKAAGLPPLTAAKVGLYQAMHEAGIGKAETRAPSRLAWAASRSVAGSAAPLQDRADRPSAASGRQGPCRQRPKSSLTAGG